MTMKIYIFLLLAVLAIPAAAAAQSDPSLTRVEPHSSTRPAMPLPTSGDSNILSGSRMTVFTKFLEVPRAVYAFTRSISSVFCLRSFNQMIWAHALASIASVQQVFRPSFVMKEPRNMVSVKNLTASITSSNSSVTGIVAESDPKPASSGLVDFFPKSFSQRSADGHKKILPCDDSLWRRVYHPQRLVIKDACISVTGVIVDATHGKRKDGVRHEADGDTHGWLRVDPLFRNLLNAGNLSDEGGNLVFEVICKFRVTQADAKAACMGMQSSVSIPPVGTRVRITGSLVRELNHGHWMEIHPVTKIEVIK